VTFSTALSKKFGIRLFFKKLFEYRVVQKKLTIFGGILGPKKK